MDSKHQATNRRERRDNESTARKLQDIELDIEVLEERIAPLSWGGGMSWFTSHFTLHGITLNRCETLVGEGE